MSDEDELFGDEEGVLHDAVTLMFSHKQGEATVEYAAFVRELFDT
eukprot:gene8781-11949_t